MDTSLYIVDDSGYFYSMDMGFFQNPRYIKNI